MRKNRASGHGVRWVVAGGEFSKWFSTRALVDNHRSGILQAMRRGEAFDTQTGLPESAAREQRSVTWLDLACAFTDMKWPHLAAKSRMSIADALATVTPVLVTTTRGMPAQRDLRAAQYGWAFNTERRNTTELTRLDAGQAGAIGWIRANSLQVTALEEKDRRSELIRRALDALALTMTGTPAAATVLARKRAVFYGVLNYVVEPDILPANPASKVRWKAPRAAEQVDRHIVASPAQVRRPLVAVAADRPELEAFFACLYHAFLRPAEAAALTIDSCVLPATGWGRLIVTGSAKRVSAAWTDDGTSIDHRQLKYRALDAVRSIPIPPALVTILRDHIERFGTAADGRLFQVTWGQRGKGGVVSVKVKVYGHVWHRARATALTRAQQSSPLAGRPYDLRHGGVTLALNAGVPAPEVASRAGHSVEVLWRVYAAASTDMKSCGTGASTKPSPTARPPRPNHQTTQQASRVVPLLIGVRARHLEDLTWRSGLVGLGSCPVNRVGMRRLLVSWPSGGKICASGVSVPGWCCWRCHRRGAARLS